MFDVRRSSFKTTPYGINATYECLQNNLALMSKVLRLIPVILSHGIPGLQRTGDPEAYFAQHYDSEDSVLSSSIRLFMASSSLFTASASLLSILASSSGFMA